VVTNDYQWGEDTMKEALEVLAGLQRRLAALKEGL